MRGVKRWRAVEPEGVALCSFLAGSPVLFFLTLGCPDFRRTRIAISVVAQYGDVDATDVAAAGHQVPDAAKVISDELVDPGVLGAKDGHAIF